jgi:hypothetical protein
VVVTIVMLASYVLVRRVSTSRLNGPSVPLR